MSNDGVESKGNFKVLTVSGTCFEMGLTHGRLLKNEIHLAVEEYLYKSSNAVQVPVEFIIDQARKSEQFIPECYREEMKGVSEGCGLEYSDILALNCMVDLDNVFSGKGHECCNFVLSSPVTRGGHVYHGRNLDYPPFGILDRISVVSIRKPSNAQRLGTVSVGWAGFVGVITGSNAEGLNAAEVSSPCVDNRVDATPIGFILRAALEESSSSGSFLTCVKRHRRMCGYNIAVSSKDGDPVAIEATTKGCHCRLSKDGALVVDNVRFSKHNDEFPYAYAAGAFRHARVMEMVRNRMDQVDMESAFKMLRDQLDSATNNSSGNNYRSICNRHTVQSVLFHVNEAKLYVSAGSLPAPMHISGASTL